MIRVLVQELGDGGKHVQSAQFTMRKEVYKTLGDHAFMVLLSRLRDLYFFLTESNHREEELNEKMTTLVSED